MTFKYDNVYLNEVSTVTGPYEKKGPIGKLFDKSYNDLYCSAKTWEQAEVKLILESVNILLNKLNKNIYDVDLHISGDLLNQTAASNYAASKLKRPFLGIYSACASSCEGLIIASNMIESNLISNCLCTASSHNNSAEKQFRYPVEYGGPKPITNTFTTTGGVSAYLSREKSNIKIESATIGVVSDYEVKDAYHMGAVMSPAAARTINDHLKDLKRDINYYDLILTGDLGRYGKDILKDFMKEEYKIEMNNHNDSACMIYDLENQPVSAGGSGPACLPLVTYSYILNEMKEKKLSKVLIVATGALLNPSMLNEKETIPSIAHAVSLEVIS